MYIIVGVGVVSGLKNVNIHISFAFFSQQKKKKKKGGKRIPKTDRSSLSSARKRSASRDREEKVARKKSRNDVSKTFGVVVCEPRVVRHAFAFVRVDGRSGTVFEKRLYRERDVERDR